MTSTEYSPAQTYLDTCDLAELLGLSVRTVRLRAKHRPWLLPPRAELYDRELVRWRQDVVERWLIARYYVTTETRCLAVANSN
jgi:hypothetical protein